MDIRSAQKIAWDTKKSVTNSSDVSFGFDQLSTEVIEAFDAWSNGDRETAERLATVAVFLLRLAEMVGTDLQEVVEAKLAVSKPSARTQEPNGEPRDTAVTATAAMNRGKLVRDKIPQIIRSTGQEPVIHTAGAEEYCIRLRDKLREEVEEYLASDNDREELADILEVLYALAEQAGTDQEQLEKLRVAKAEKRGGFAERIIWFYNRRASTAQDMTLTAAKL
jgi:predicted house-cleaning noncanonical NTP pyrophosphatase (MazG superfamily)